MRHQQDDEKCALPKGHYPFILSNLFADLVKRINVQSGGLANRSRAIRAKAALVNASTGVCLRQQQPGAPSQIGGDESETVAWHSSGAKARRENASRPRAQRVVGRGAGGLRPPCFFNSTPMRSIGYGWGDFLTRPPTPAHSLTRISPTLPTASGGRGRRSAAQRRRVVEGACGTHYS